LKSAAAVDSRLGAVRFGPKDVDVAQIYDGFSASTVLGRESYGFWDEDAALDFI
jgi:hypothetical protein